MQHLVNFHLVFDFDFDYLIVVFDFSTCTCAFPKTYLRPRMRLVCTCLDLLQCVGVIFKKHFAYLMQLKQPLFVEPFYITCGA